MLKSAKSFEFASLRKRHSYHLEQSTVTKNGTIPQSLGLIIQNNLKWGEQIFSTITKASKRLYALRIFSRGGVPLGVPPADLINSYYALIRSILEYCCEVWDMPCRAICGTNWRRRVCTQASDAYCLPWSFIWWGSPVSWLYKTWRQAKQNVY